MVGRRQQCSDKTSRRSNRNYSPLWEHKPRHIPTKDRWAINRRADHPQHRWLQGYTYWKEQFILLHTLMGSKLTVTTEHLHHVAVDGSVEAPAQCTVGVRKKQTSCLTVFGKGKKKMLRISKCHCINWKRKPHLGCWTYHRRKRYGRKNKEDREGEKKIIMVLKRAHKKRFKMLGGSFD